MSLNKWIGIGRITHDPELKETPQGVKVCSFQLAVDRSFVKKGEDRQTDFISVVAWRGTAEFIVKYFTKGQLMNIVGSLQTRTYEKDGERRRVTEVVAEEVNFCGDRKKTEETSVGTGFSEVDDNADLPF